MSLPRFIGKVEGDRFTLTDGEAHHCFVRRIKEGQKIEVNNLQGQVYLCKVERINKGLVEGEVLQEVKQKGEGKYIELFLGMPNRLSKVDDLMEAITEMGTTKLIPVITKNTAVKEKDILKKIPKWEKISLNSIKQCKRLFPVEIQKPIKVKDIYPTAEEKVVFYERAEEKYPCKEGLSSVAVFVGAEGGITEEEIQILQEKGFRPYSLGDNILRMETAVITALCKANS